MPHQANFENLRRTLLRQGPPGPVPFFELFADPGMVEAVLGEKFPADLHRFIQEPTRMPSEDELPAVMHSLDMYVRFCRECGYDYVVMVTGFSLARAFKTSADTSASKNWPGGSRYWQDETTGPIQNWADFEAYPWPKPEELNHLALEYVSSVLPEGMKAAAFMYGGVFELSCWLMGLQPFSMALFDQPDLVEAISNRVGELEVATAAQVVAIDNVEAVYFSDDLGYYSSTLISPAALRKYVFPHYKKVSRVVRDAGKLFVYHSCGNMYKVMDELIDDVVIHAKHSFEDKILSVEEAYRRWGDRIAILGGVDMDLLARGSEEQVRKRVREILDVCGAKGTGYCLGTGNTAANYIPRQNFLAMLDEGRRWNQEHFGVS